MEPAQQEEDDRRDRGGGDRVADPERPDGEEQAGVDGMPSTAAVAAVTTTAATAGAATTPMRTNRPTSRSPDYGRMA
jgi:hypothetical protein